MIKFTDVFKTYENGTKALKGISFEIQDGEFVFLVGPSGSGKTTIIKLITGEIAPMDGTVNVNGFDMGNIRFGKMPYMRRTLGVVFQDFRLIEDKSVYENVAFAMRVVGASNKEIRRRVPYVLELVGLDTRTKRRPQELSGGEQQRVAIARALVNNPSLIIADEPTGNLDPPRSLEIMMLLEKINELGTTVLVVTHEKELVNKKHNRLGYYIKEGIVSVFNHGFMSFASICIIVACLLIMGTFTLLSLNIDNMIDAMESENQILAYVDESLSEDEARALEPVIERIPNVADAQFISREEAMETFVNSHENSTIFEGVDATVFRHRFVINLDDISKMADTQARLLTTAGIARVNAHLEISRGFIRIRSVVTTVSIALVVILFVISLFIMSNTIKLTTFERKDEIAIMKMVGATSSFIRWPFVVEGLILAAFGSLSAYILQYGIYRLLTEKLISNTGFTFITALPFSVIAVPMLIVFLAVGFCVGVIGSLIAIKNYLKV